MVRRSLIAMALLAVAAPLAAQSMPAPEEWTWTHDRPDGSAPVTVFGARLMSAGEIEIGYRFSQQNWQGVWAGTDSIGFVSAQARFADVPIDRQDVRHIARLAFGVSDDLTVVATANWVILERQTFITPEGRRAFWGAEGLADVEVGALYSVYSGGPYRLHVQGGAVLPTGTVTTYGARTDGGAEQPLPYDMRPGGGTFGIVLGMSGNVQNEFGSVGGQFRLRTNIGKNSAGSTGYKLGDEYEAQGWAAYRINEHFSVSAGGRWQAWGGLEGMDDRLVVMSDPMAQHRTLSGQRALLPLGLNFMLPESSRFAGHRLGIEAVYTLHTDYDAPQIGLDWGFNFGWQMSF